MHNNLVTIENVTFGYDEDRPILKDISLTIPQGLMVAIMGGSGCGKTTLLRLISGQIKPQTGSVTVFGEDINSLSNRNILKLRTKMGMLFQFGALFTDMSVYENVAFSLKEHTNLPETLIKKLLL